MASSFLNIQKPFNFVYKGHNYTHDDSARNQDYCPHCGKRTNAINNINKDNGYIGKYKYGQNENENLYCFCYECIFCYEKYFFHKSVFKWTE